jgi:glycosyltransferase involved in cell wall biosynthesis
VLLPAYNQAAGLEGIAESFLRAFARLDRAIQFVIIDDASTDDTAAIAEKLVTRHTDLLLLRHDTRHGFGAALRTGLASAVHPLVFYSSCDYPYPPGDILKLLDLIDAADLVSGCRTDRVPAWLRRLDAAKWLFARIVFGVSLEPRPGWLGWPDWQRAVQLRGVFALRLWDPMSCFKLFRRAALDRIPIQSDGQFVHAELLAKANFLGCLMAEVPVGRLAGNFKGALESEPPGAEFRSEARRAFRRPRFVRESQKPDGPAEDILAGPSG